MCMYAYQFVWANPPQSPIARLVMLGLADFHGPLGLIFPSMDTLAEKCGLTTRGLRNILQALEDENRIAVVRRKRGSYHYTLVGFVAPPPEVYAAANRNAVPSEPEPRSPEPKREPKNGGGGGRPPETPVVDLPTASPTYRGRLLGKLGLDHTGVDPLTGQFYGTTNHMGTARGWRLLGLTEDECVQVVGEVMATKRDGLPSGFSYFTKAMRRLAQAKTDAATAPHPTDRHRTSPSVTPAKRTSSHGTRRERNFSAEGVWGILAALPVVQRPDHGAATPRLSG